jgi:hypothetical protein
MDPLVMSTVLIAGIDETDDPVTMSAGIDKPQYPRVALHKLRLDC